MKRRHDKASGPPPGEPGRELRHDAEADREYTTPERARKADAGQPLEPPEGKDPPAPRGEDDQGRPIEREKPSRR